MAFTIRQIANCLLVKYFVCAFSKVHIWFRKWGRAGAFIILFLLLSILFVVDIVTYYRTGTFFTQTLLTFLFQFRSLISSVLIDIFLFLIAWRLAGKVKNMCCTLAVRRRVVPEILKDDVIFPR